MLRISKNQLGTAVADLGVLIGLLNDEDDGHVSVKTGWFGGPVSEVEQTPTRAKELFGVISDFFTATDGTEYTLLGQGEVWYSIFSGYDELPTGLCLVTPQTGSTSGLISLGIFEQLAVDDLTISLTARLPLFYMQEGQLPEFVLTSNRPDYKNFTIEIDVYSSVAVQLGSDSPFNMMSVSATAEFNDSFTTDFKLSFYEGFDPQTGNKTELPAASIDVVIERIGALVVQANYWLNKYIGSAPVTIGDILSATGLVTQTVDQTTGSTTYQFNQQTFNNLSKDPTEVLKNFLITLLTKLLDDLSSSQTLLLPILGGGIYATKDTATNTYGLRLAIPDYVLNSASDLSSAGSSGPQVTVQLGKWFTGENGNNNWIENISSQQVDPGIDVFFLHYDGKTLSTTAYIKLASLGFDISGQGTTPLIDLNGYTLQGVELRAYLDSNDWAYGFALRMDDVGFPLGPSFDEAQQGQSGTNVVAQSLLSSGSSSSNGQNGTGKTSAVNPAFSAEAGYIKGNDPLLEIFDPQGNQTDLIWFPIQRRFGPVNCEKVGFKVDVTGSHKDDPVLGLVFDGGVSLSVLDIYLDQLSVDVHLKEISNTSGYSIDLQGMDVTFNGSGIELSGGLLKTTDENNLIAYDGEALIKVEDLTIAALGSFGSLPGGGTSLFIFAMLNYPIGGPAFFYVTGLAAGFGYNRSLKIPAQSDVQNFPLVAGLANTSLIGGDKPTPQQALTILESWVPPTRGEYWFAAGVQFTTFEIINTNALLIVEFGNEFIISILGLSTLKQPIAGETYVYAELGIEVVLMPQAGEFKASAVLSPSSYVLTQQAHLTGGFAFYAWFGSNEHSGDFVFTIGGYHPAFNVPTYYPQEPRVGINWQVSDHIEIVGGAYFALTPTAMMAGTGLQLTFHDGSLKAWLKVQADLILYWKPFYLQADVSISIGVSYRIDALFVHMTVSAELGANFSLWGPPVGGKVHVDWYIISFTIGFGASPNPPTSINWDDFKGMLPSKTEQQQQATQSSHALNSQFAQQDSAMLVFAATDTQTTTTTTTAVLNINANAGLKRTKTEDDLTLWLVRPGQFKFTINSALPASSIVVQSENSADDRTLAGTQVGMRRVNGGIAASAYNSTQTIAILALKVDDVASIKACMATTSACTTQPSGCNGTPVIVTDWEIDTVSKNMPTAMWGDIIPAGQDPDINAAIPAVTATIGVTMNPKPPVINNCTPEMVIDVIFSDRVVNATDEYRLPLSQTAQPPAPSPQMAQTFTDIMNINTPTVSQTRGALFAALENMGLSPSTNDALPQMAATPGQDFADEPLEGSPVATLS